jgi:hypothetical protein
MKPVLPPLLICAALLLPPFAAASDSPSFANNILLLPRVDTVDRAGQYQSARFERLADGSWRLIAVESLPSSRLQAVVVGEVEVLKTASFPVAVYLRASGGQQVCGHDGPARVHQRTVAGRLEVVISVRLNDLASEQLAQYGALACPAVWRPFKMTIPLPVYGLAAGTHRYAVNGVVGSFTLERDNVLPGDCDAGEAAERLRCQ